jgi:hypothetical protein
VHCLSCLCAHAADDGVNPALLPFGVIFSCFMVCIMIGSSFFSLASNSGVAPATVLTYVLGAAAVALFVAGNSTSVVATSVGFLAFETTCGLYFPRCGTGPNRTECLVAWLQWLSICVAP